MPSKTCRVRGCKREASIREVCNSCYTSARKMVERGISTWEQLEQLGLVAAVHRQHRSPMRAEFERLKASNGNRKKGAKAK